MDVGRAAALLSTLGLLAPQKNEKGAPISPEFARSGLSSARSRRDYWVGSRLGCRRSEGPQLLSPGASLARLLQNRNLPRVIQLVLRDPMQHVIEIVPLPRNLIA